jgi:hypothetical protein
MTRGRNFKRAVESKIWRETQRGPAENEASQNIAEEGEREGKREVLRDRAAGRGRLLGLMGRWERGRI